MSKSHSLTICFTMDGNSHFLFVLITNLFYHFKPDVFHHTSKEYRMPMEDDRTKMKKCLTFFKN